MKLPAAIAAALTLTACSPPPAPLLCDREAIPYDKWGEPSELPPECLPAPANPIIFLAPDRPDFDRPERPDTSTKPETPDEPNQPPRPKGNNGLGNGDQTAPGNSGPNNRAENERGNPGHASGKPQNAN